MIWAWVLLFIVVSTGAVIILSYIFNIIGASIKAVTYIMASIATIIVLTVMIVTILDYTIYPNIWNNIINWF